MKAKAVHIESQYDFVVCGSGSSGSVVARRLAENPDVSVLLLEAGGDDEVADIKDASAWPKLRGGPQDWGFSAVGNPNLDNRSIPMAMGKVLGGGSSINVMAWSRGHKADWDFFASETEDDGWSYRSVLEIYKRIEDWHGESDPERRGRGGILFVEAPKELSPLASAMIEGFEQAGLPRYADQNGAMMEGSGGVAPSNMCVREGQRQSVYRAYVHPIIEKPNLTVVTHATVTKVLIKGREATGIAFSYDGEMRQVSANLEVILSLGAINTPKILMLSGIGNEKDLQRVGIPTVVNLPGVGANFQDHFMAPCVWESPVPVEKRANLGEITAMWKSEPGLDRPDMQSFLSALGYASPHVRPREMPANSWSMTTAVLRTASRGRLLLSSSDANDPIRIDCNFLDDPDDLRRLKTCIAFCRSVGNSPALAPFRTREILPLSYAGSLESFMRNGTVSHSHQSCTAKMGRDHMAVVSSRLDVYGIRNLRIADASVIPRITTGNTMAPCVVIGERASDLIKADYGL